MPNMNGVNSSNVSQIDRIVNCCDDNIKFFDDLKKIEPSKLNALLNANRITDELISVATTLEGEGSAALLSSVIKLLNNGFPLCDEVIEVAKDQKKSAILCDARDYIRMHEIFEFFNPQFDSEQYDEILKGFQRGIHQNRIRFYASEKFDASQMREIRKAFRNGVTDKNVRIIANSMLPSTMMRQMRKGFENGLAKAEVLVYAHDFFDVNQMHYIRKTLEQNFSTEFVCFIANPEFSAEQMAYCLEGFECGFTTEEVESYIRLPEVEREKKLHKLHEKHLEKKITRKI